MGIDDEESAASIEKCYNILRFNFSFGNSTD